MANKIDPSQCAGPQQRLSQCAEQAMPLLQAIKKHCNEHMRAYDACLREHGKKSDDELASLCTPKLRGLWQCTEAVKAHAVMVAKEDEQSSGSAERA